MHALTTTGVLCMYPIKSLLKGPVLAYNMADLFHQECCWKEKQVRELRWGSQHLAGRHNQVKLERKMKKEYENVFEHVFSNYRYPYAKEYTVSILLVHLHLHVYSSFQKEYFGLMPIYILLKNLVSSRNECIPLTWGLKILDILVSSSYPIWIFLCCCMKALITASQLFFFTNGMEPILRTVYMIEVRGTIRSQRQKI